MKIGFVLECGPAGADKKVCEAAARRLGPAGLRLVSRTLDNKPNLVTGCGEAASGLLSIHKCDKVLVVWDLYPNWRGKDDKPCRQVDRNIALASLEKAGLKGDGRISLVCIEEELEAWLLADQNAIHAVREKYVHPTHRAKIPKIKKFKNCESVKNPKGVLKGLFAECPGRVVYSDIEHAHAIFEAITDLGKLDRVDSFKRFADKVRA